MENFGLDNLLIPGQRIHIVGISGFGMSAIARVLLETGYIVTGSDQRLTPLTEWLSRDGADIHLGHDAGNVVGAEMVLASSAIPDTNVEVKSAHALGIPVLDRREAIEMITAGHRTIAIAGTHGKTTTTALLTHVLMSAGIDPSYIVGGIMNNTYTNAGVGQSDIFVIEADEYGEMFLGLNPHIAVVTNVEYDHPDQFADMKSMMGIFHRFVQRLDEQGLLVACLDSPPAAIFANNRLTQGLPVDTYSLQNSQADWLASNREPHEKSGMRFVVKHHGAPLGQTHLNLMGDYNIENALAVVAVARHLGVPFSDITKAFASFQGIGRRAEILGQMKGVTIVSDYAHHPTAIRETLKAWRARPEAKRIWAVWQPHTFNRLRALSEEFSMAFDEADEILVTSVYSVREAKTEGIDAPDIAKLISKKSGHQTRFSGSLELTTKLLASEVTEGDVVVILSAGDAPEIGQKLLETLMK